jgi:hypothetical protein
MIEDFREIRLDGKVIFEGDSIEKIRSLGPISRVVRVQWKNESRTLGRSNPFGVFASILPGRDALACIEPSGENDAPRSLKVINADGTIRYEVPQNFKLDNSEKMVRYLYINPTVEDRTTFGAVFDVIGEDGQYRAVIYYKKGQKFR